MEELRRKTVKELRDIAKSLNITGRWDMNKSQLIDAINGYGFDDRDITFETDCIINDDMKSNPEGSQKVTRTTDEYIDTISSGTLVAFKRNVNNDIAMSGKFVRFSDDFHTRLIIETKNGTMFNIKRESIVWVKTGERWPRWVYSMFSQHKGDSNDAVSEN